MPSSHDKQSLADLIHALRTPLVAAQRRLKDALRQLPPNADDVRAAHVAVVRASRTLDNFKVTADVDLRDSLRATLVSVPLKSVYDSIRTVIEDVRLLYHDVEFRLNEMNLPKGNVEVDLNLFEVALTNILDNAGKYSYAGTIVMTRVGIRQGRFAVLVRNQGIAMPASVARHAVERGWTGAEARASGSSGWGLGLWVTDHIMRAHGGELLIEPTFEPGPTTIVGLTIPISHHRGQSHEHSDR